MSAQLLRLDCSDSYSGPEGRTNVLCDDFLCVMRDATISYASCTDFLCIAAHVLGTATKLNRNEAGNGGGYAGSLLNVWANDELGIVAALFHTGL